LLYKQSVALEARGERKMSCSVDIPEFLQTYTFIELDRNGVQMHSGEIKIKRYKRHMWIFDIGDGHTLGIYVSPMSISNSTRNFVADSPTYVRDDLTFKVFQHEKYDRRYLSNPFGHVATIQRNTKYNAVSLHPMYEQNEDHSKSHIVFAVPRLHIENIAALTAPLPCDIPKSLSHISAATRPAMQVIRRGHYDFLLDEITPCGDSAAHQMISTMWSKDLCPMTQFQSVYVAPHNLLRIVLCNNSDEDMEFEVQPDFANTYEYAKTCILVGAGARETMQPFGSDAVFLGFRVTMLNKNLHARVSSVFRVYEQSSEDVARTTGTCILPLSLGTVESPLVAPAVVDDVCIVPEQQMQQNLQRTKQSLQTLQHHRETILDRLLQSTQITALEFDVLSLCSPVSSSVDHSCDE